MFDPFNLILQDPTRVDKRYLLELDYVPQVKQSTQFARNRGFLPKKKREYITSLRELIELQWKENPLLTGPVRVRVVFSFPWRQQDKKIRKRLDWSYHMLTRDIDNLQKMLFDCMKGICFEDDRQIVSVQAWKIWCQSFGFFVIVESLIPNDSLPLSE